MLTEEVLSSEDCLYLKAASLGLTEFINYENCFVTAALLNQMKEPYSIRLATRLILLLDKEVAALCYSSCQNTISHPLMDRFCLNEPLSRKSLLVHDLVGQNEPEGLVSGFSHFKF